MTFNSQKSNNYIIQGGIYMKHFLGEQISKWRDDCEWVELSREVSLETPHHSAFPDMEMNIIYDYDKGDGFQAHVYKMAGQYGTHVDAPIHMSEGGKTLEAFGPAEMFLPLCVVDLAKEVAENPNYALSVDDLKAWEERNGRIPEGAFVAFRSDWYNRKTYEEIQNLDAEGNANYPGWSVEALKFLNEERGVVAIGHEPADTDPAEIASTIGWIAEKYWLSNELYQIELMANLDKCPESGALIFCTFPKIKGGSGSTARCIALVPKK